jgi:hypothetical protein
VHPEKWDQTDPESAFAESPRPSAPEEMDFDVLDTILEALGGGHVARPARGSSVPRQKLLKHVSYRCLYSDPMDVEHFVLADADTETLANPVNVIRLALYAGQVDPRWCALLSVWLAELATHFVTSGRSL